MRVATFLCLFPLGAALAQDSARYRASPDTLRYTSLNSYLMYFVRGADTLGQPITTTTREHRSIQLAGPGLTLWVRLEGMGGQAFRSEATYTIAPSGRVLAVDGRPVSEVPTARVDVLPRFPSAVVPLQLGAEWVDTVSVRGTQSYGSTFYDVRRAYRVLKFVDTLGTRLAIIAGRGEMSLRQGGWQDSARGLVWWQQVAGPVVDTIWFDTRAGRIVASVALMDLAGTGGAGPTGSDGGMASGLRSSVRLAIQSR